MPSDRLRGGPAGRATGEDAAAEKGALERAVAVQPTAAEAGDLSRGIQAGDGFPVAAEHPGVEVGLQAAKALAGEHVQPDGDEGAVLRVENLVGPRRANQLVAAVVRAPWMAVT